MTLKNYLFVSGILFLAIALLHLVRAVNGWTFILGPYDLPLLMSWFAMLLTGALGIIALRLGAKV